jgi:hypothetical protein
MRLEAEKSFSGDLDRWLNCDGGRDVMRGCEIAQFRDDLE